MSETPYLIEGAYYTYQPDSRFSREGIALAIKYTDSSALYLGDTFWGENGRSSGFGWRFSEKELSTVQFLFNPGDGTWREATVNDIIHDYDSSDYVTVTSQHGHYVKRWFKKDAKPSLTAQLEHALGEVLEAETKLSAAERRLQHAILRKEKIEALIAASQEKASQK